MPQTLRTSLIVQAIIFTAVFTLVFVIEEKAYPEEVNFSDTLLAYFTALPVWWGGKFGGFFTYLFLFLVALSSLFLSTNLSFRRWSLPTFNLSAALWIIFPALAYHFGEYSGP